MNLSARTLFLIVLASVPGLLRGSVPLLTVYQDGHYSCQQDVVLPQGPAAEIPGLPDSTDPYSMVLTSLSQDLRIISWEFAGPPQAAASDPYSRLTNKQIDLVDSADHPFKGRILRTWPDSILLRQEGSGQSFLFYKKDIKAVQLSPAAAASLTDIPLLPSRTLHVNFDKPSAGTIRLYYEAEGVSCTPMYKAFLDEKAGTVELLGEFFLENSTDLEWQDAEIEYLEGEVQRNPRPSKPGLFFNKIPVSTASVTSPGNEESNKTDLFEYTRYAVKAPGGLAASSSRHVTRFRTQPLPFRKSFYYNADLEERGNLVWTKIAFTNCLRAGLGQTLAAGAVKLYTATNSRIRFIGECRLERCMEGEEIRLIPGASRDVRVTRSSQSQKRISDRIQESSVQFTVKNDKTVPVILEIEEPISSNQEIRTSSDPYRKNGTRSVSFYLEIPASSDRTVTYTAWVRQ